MQGQPRPPSWVVLGEGWWSQQTAPCGLLLQSRAVTRVRHLYAGAGVVVCWAMAASVVPLMSKGKDWARYAHIGFNVIALGFFTWQLPTGWQITMKVIEKTKFP